MSLLYPQALGTHFIRLLRHAWVTVRLFFNPGHYTGNQIFDNLINAFFSLLVDYFLFLLGIYRTDYVVIRSVNVLGSRCIIKSVSQSVNVCRSCSRNVLPRPLCSFSRLTVLLGSIVRFMAVGKDTHFRLREAGNHGYGLTCSTDGQFAWQVFIQVRPSATLC
jgi:hypothetical protein